MGDIILFIVVIVGLTTVWIEWAPLKYDVLIGVFFSIIIIGIGLGWMPRWYGWVVLAIGIADLAWQYNKGVRKFGWPELPDLLQSIGRVVQASLGKAATLFSRSGKPVIRTPAPAETTAPEPPSARTPRRVWVGGIALTAFSPITAIPAAIILAMVLTILNTMLIDTDTLMLSVAEISKSVLGNAFMIQVASLDLVFRGFLLTGPLFLFAGVGGAKWADRTGRYWQRLLVAGVMIGALYPAIFIVASTLGWFDEPFFN